MPAQGHTPQRALFRIHGIAPSLVGAVVLGSSSIAACQTVMPQPAIATIATFEDRDADGVVSDEERAKAIYDDVRAIVQRHLDGGASIFSDQGDWQALRNDLTRYVYSLAGDLNADGVVDAADHALLQQNLGRADGVLPLEGDLDRDGDVDNNDAAIAIGAHGNTVNLTPQGARTKLREAMDAVPSNYDNEPLMASSDRGPDGHTVAITSTWPDPPQQFPPADWDWPANHHGSISQYWPSPAEDWPASHYAAITEEWNTHEHEADLSKHWPSSHTVGMSNTWPCQGRPSCFDPDEDVVPGHQLDVSPLWPPGHVGSLSRQVPPAFQHVGYISQAWDHEVDQSLQSWPPSHIEELSRSWTDHDVGTSMEWPAGHHRGISETWPAPDRGWPANHAASVSVTWGQPKDHNVTESILQHPANPYGGALND